MNRPQITKETLKELREELFAKQKEASLAEEESHIKSLSTQKNGIGDKIDIDESLNDEMENGICQ